MPISTDALIDFFGTQDSIDDGSTSSVTNNSFSVAADITSWTNDDDAPFAVFVMRCQFGTAPTDGSLINIYGRKMNVQSTNDTPVPTAVNTDQYLGSFVVDGDVGTATNAYLVTSRISLPNHTTSQVYDFYFENKTRHTISSGWAAWITPCTKGPHP